MGMTRLKVPEVALASALRSAMRIHTRPIPCEALLVDFEKSCLILNDLKKS